MTTPIGIDTGGTFTDFITFDAGGRARIHKQPSTPDDPSRAVAAGLAALGGPPDAAVIHGSTVATNALLERRGARTALVTTAGFRDVLEIGRQNRPDLYALVPQKPPPLVPRKWRFEVGERVTAAGEVLRPLDEAALDRGPGATGGRGHRVRRRLPAVLLPLSRPRAARRRAAARGAGAGRPRVPFGRRAARIPRVRAHRGHGHQRLRRPADEPLPRPAGGRHRPAPSVDHAEQRRPPQRRRRRRRGGPRARPSAARPAASSARATWPPPPGRTAAVSPT